MAEQRTDLAGSRTDLSGYRSLLARGRTELALIRTGLAFVASGLALARYFGFGYWTLLDGSLMLVGTVATIYGLKWFVRTLRNGRKFQHQLEQLLIAPEERS
jgi:uncharacterized membrane protein YidH (DUF202 family)